MNPYLAGILLGLVLLAAMYLSGRGLGASGGIKNAVVAWLALLTNNMLQRLITANTMKTGRIRLKTG